MRTLILLCLVAVAWAQYDGGFVKILQDKRYQSGGTFGNFRDQEDGTKYFEETDEQGVRRGYWEYVDETGRTIRNEFEAGPGIGFRITKSNQHSGTATAAAPRPRAQPPPTSAPQYHPVEPQYHPVQPQYQPIPVHVPAPVAAPAPIPIPTAPRFSTLQPEPQNLFDYPGNLEFSRSHQGHRFKFVAA